MNINGHGGDVYAASRELGCGVERIVDFSASINPLGPSPRVWRALSHAHEALKHYPDPTCLDLRTALASLWGCSVGHIIVGNGSTELIHLLPTSLGLRHLLIVGPTFSEYAASMVRMKRRITTVYAERREGYRPPIERIASLLGRKPPRHGGIDSVVLCNPNSPTGQACDAAAVMRLARMAQRRKVLFIVDEAFVDYCPERSVLPLSSNVPNVIVLRSLTKFFGLPGLRVGYAVAARSLVERMERHLPPWSVNALGQLAGLAALRDEHHATRSLLYMKGERKRFLAKLTTLRGFVAFPSEANFLMLELPPGCSAARTAAQLRRKGLLVRDGSSIPGIERQTLRIAVRTRQENDRLINALSGLFTRR